MKRRRLAGLVLATALALAGCATPPPPAPGAGKAWSGRLAVQVEDKPSQSFSAGFELRGHAAQGELRLYSPLGGTLAQLQWAPGLALLKTDGQERRFDSVEALIEAATGAPVPVAALFDWLAGADTPVNGWKADLSQLAQGRLSAQRYAPPPATQLRMVLERP
ncbi:MAG TPA: outer membrane lipoprotein LolB [Ramlibacter sp.]|nr:outer membrane lipoprotein LolB [Ramlibacter sp.]